MLIIKLKNNKLLLKVIVVTIFLFSFLFLFSSFVPFNQDEFIQYHPISCYYYPLNKLNTFRESCAFYDLAPISNLHLPLRSFRYVGSFPALVYYPLFRLWPSPNSARFLGLIMLAIQAYLLAKLFKRDLLLSFVILIAFMPYAFQHLADTGPVSFHTTSVILIYYLSQKWITALAKGVKYSWLYPLFIGLVVFLGIWTKLVYLSLIPGILVLLLYTIITKRNILTCEPKLEKFATHLTILLVVATIPSLMLLNAKDRTGYQYLAVMVNSESAKIFNFDALPSNLDNLSSYLFNPLMASNRIFEVKEEKVTPGGVFLVAIVIVLFTIGIRQCIRRKKNYSFAIINILLFILTFLLICKSPEAKHMHHVVLSFPFLILALFDIYSKARPSKPFLLTLVIFLGINLSLYYSLTKLKYGEHDHPAKPRLNNLLNRQYANQYVFVVIDWGMYYLKALYGDKNQCVLYLEPLIAGKQIEEVKAILNKTQRKALFIGRTDSVSNLTLISQNFPSLTKLETGFDTGKWGVWYEP